MIPLFHTNGQDYGRGTMKSVECWSRSKRHPIKAPSPLFRAKQSRLVG
ncbi:MAG: hypothetical protein ACON38_03065 [Akkermansiaceae bacterium]